MATDRSPDPGQRRADDESGWGYTTGAYAADTSPGVTAKSSDWLETQSQMPFIREVARRTSALLGLLPGERVLEVGCGTGVFLPSLAAAVGSAGRVVGIDHSSQFLDQARERIHRSRLDNVDLLVGDARHLPFPDATFDAAHCERVLMHLDDMVPAIEEMVRVVRPGGRIVTAEVYANAAAIDVPHPAAMRRAMLELVSGIANPDAGIQLRRRFIEAGLRDVSGTVVADFEEDLDPEESAEIAAIVEDLVGRGEIARSHGEELVDAMHRRLAAGTHCGTALIFVVAGRVPDA